MGKQSVESSELEETDQNSPVQVENDIDKMSNVFARVVLLVSFNVSSFDYLSVKGNLEPVAKYLKVRTRGMGKYEMAVPIAKELLRKGYVTYINTYLIDHSPLGLFRANETNN